LTDGACTKFREFYAGKPDEILREEDLRFTDRAGDLGAHAVVLIGSDASSIEFLNSWGYRFAGKGRFRVQNAETLGLAFYDVFWEEDDLSQEEKAAYGNYCRQHQTGAARADEGFSSLGALYFRCQNCRHLIRNDAVADNYQYCLSNNTERGPDGRFGYGRRFDPKKATVIRGLLP
jgi:hypothetical protein